MNLDFKGYHNNCKDSLMGDLIIHKGRRLTERETRILVNYAIEQGWETTADVPDCVVDEICDPYVFNPKWDKYDDTPDFYTLDELKNALNAIHRSWRDDWEPDELFDRISEQL